MEVTCLLLLVILLEKNKILLQISFDGNLSLSNERNEIWNWNLTFFFINEIGLRLGEATTLRCGVASQISTTPHNTSWKFPMR